LPTGWKLPEPGICTVALLTGAPHEYHHHAPNYLKSGGTQAGLDVKVTNEVFAQLKQHFDTTQIVELTAAIATYNMVARFLVAMGVSPEV